MEVSYPNSGLVFMVKMKWEEGIADCRLALWYMPKTSTHGRLRKENRYTLLVSLFQMYTETPYWNRNNKTIAVPNILHESPFQVNFVGSIFYFLYKLTFKLIQILSINVFYRHDLLGSLCFFNSTHDSLSYNIV